MREEGIRFCSPCVLSFVFFSQRGKNVEREILGGKKSYCRFVICRVNETGQGDKLNPLVRNMFDHGFMLEPCPVVKK